MSWILPFYKFISSGAAQENISHQSWLWTIGKWQMRSKYQQVGLQGGALFLLIHFHDCNGSIEAPDTKLYPSSIPFPHVRCHERRGDGHWPLFNCYHHHRYQVCTKIQFLSSRCNLKILRSKGMLGISFWKLILDVDGEQDTEKKNQGKVTLQSAKFLVLV